MKKTIVVFGADGMVGRAVFHYLTQFSNDNVYGTTRARKNVQEKKVFFNAYSYQRDFQKLTRQIPRLDYVINCIAILDAAAPRKELVFINSLFPHLLEEYAERNNFNLIHISTDGVFGPTVGEVNELSSPVPIDDYGGSKFLGETASRNAITIRSSFLGFDPKTHKGLLEYASSQEDTITGFTNQIWTGCTTEQFAQFCFDLIENGVFYDLRRQSNIFHFTPLGPISKYELLKKYIDVIR